MQSLASLITFGWLATQNPTLAIPTSTSSRGNHFHLVAGNSQQVDHNNGTTWPWQFYQSSNVTPPYLSINRSSEPLAPGYIFIGQYGDGTGGIKSNAPFIIGDDNELIWGGPPVTAYNFRSQNWNDKSVITWFESTAISPNGADYGHSWGKVQIYDDEYRLVKTVCPKLNLTLPTGTTADCDGDIHESLITDNNTILVTAYNTTQADLTSVGGTTDGWVYDSLAVEIDLQTNEPVFIWSALQHLPVNVSRLAYTQGTQDSPYDFFHINSIQKWGDYYVINSRHTWGTFIVDRQGDIVWYIDGADGGDFGSLPLNGNFSWQHMARIHNVSSNNAILTYFANDLDSASPNIFSKGLTFNLTLPPSPAHPPELLTDFWDAENPVAAASQGSFTSLSNGNTLIGYGEQPVAKEFGPQGDVRWSGQFAALGSASSYRTYKQEWHATPYTNLSLIVANITSPDSLSNQTGTSNLRGWVSWNGATGVEKYQVYTGNNPSDLHSLGRIENKGFETVFSLPSGTRYVQVGAIKSGRLVRKSDIIYAWI